MTNREISLKRAQELKNYVAPFLAVKDNIPLGTTAAFQSHYQINKQKLLSSLGAAESDWADWQWQFKNRITTEEQLGSILPLSADQKAAIRTVSGKYRWATTPYYLALINPDDPDDPVRKLSVPQLCEMDERGYADPMAEEYTNPAGSITRRYPDRLIINATNACAMYCRHCQRRRKIGESDRHTKKELIDESIRYIQENPEIRDVLITGGDPLTMSASQIESILSRVRAIPHVEIIRIGTRTLVTMPMRITDELAKMLSRYHPIYVNTQFNHPAEITPESAAACERLANHGVCLGNQMVLLRGINDDKYVVRLLNQELLKIRVRPYYIFHAKRVVGTYHFRTSIDKGLEIMQYLRGNTSGLAIPTYIVNAPGGLGKTPILPQYLQSISPEKIVLRTWEGKALEYPNQ